MYRPLSGRWNTGGSRWMIGLLLAPGLFSNVSMTSLTVSPGEIVAGTSSTGTVAVTTPDALYTTVNLSSSDASIVQVPSSIRIQRKLSSGTFPIQSLSTEAGCPKIVASIAGTVPLAQRSVIVYVRPVDPSGTHLSITVSPNTVVGGASTIATVSLVEPMGTGPVNVTLSSNSANAVVSSSMTLPAGVPTEDGFAVARASVAIGTHDPGTASCAVITARTQNGTERSRVLLKIGS